MDVLEAALDSEICKQDTDDIKRAKERLRLAKEKEDKKAQASACDDLAWSYYAIGNYSQSKIYGQELLNISKVLKNKNHTAGAYDVLAWSYYNEGDYEKSKKYGENLLTISKKVGDETLKATACSVLAWSYKEDKDFTKSEKYAQELLEISRRVKDKNQEASAYHVLAWSYYYKEEYKKSQTNGKKFLNACEKLGKKKLEAKACDVLAWSYYSDKNYKKCKEYGGKVLSISKELGDKELEAYARDILAWSCYDVGDYEKSKEYGQELLTISKELGDKKQEAQACDILAWSYYDAGDYEKSKEYGQELLSISEELGEKKQKAQAYAVLAWTYYKGTDYEQSKTYGKKFLSLSQELGEREREAKAYELLTQSYYEEKDYEQSKTYGKKFLTISKDLGDKKKEAKACDVLLMSCYEERDYEESKTYCKELLTISKELCDNELKTKALNFLDRLNSELNKEYSKNSPSIAKGVKDKNLEEEEACGGTELPERDIFNLLRQIEQEAWEDTNNNENGLPENFKRNTKEKGFSISDNQGEGDCMFLALSEQLHLKKGIKTSQAELRKTVVQYLRKNPKLRDGTDLFQFVDGCSSWDAYLTSMMTNGTWGDHVILHGAANHFKTCIQVVSSHHDDVMICPKYDVTGSNRLVLGHVHELHYVSLIPRKRVPNEIKARGPRAKLAYENALKKGKVKVYRTRIMLIGQDRAGKTSLKKSFLGLPFDPEEKSTDGIEVDPSKFEVDIDQVKKWKRTDEKFGLSQFASDIAKMVAEELQKDEDEGIEDEGKDDEGNEDEGEGKLNLAQYGDALGELHEEEASVVNSQTSQGATGKDKKEANTAVPTDLNVDFNLPPEEFTDHLCQLLEGLNLPSDAKEVEQNMILDLWDFAGQHLYYASYPVFLSSRALYMLVYDLSKDLKDTAQPSFKQGIGEIPESNPNKETNLDNFLTWLVSLSTMCSPKPEENHQETKAKDLPYCRPPVFIVGTHADKPHQDIKEVESQIKHEISGKDYECHVIRPFFSVDNTQGSSDEGVVALQKKMIEILNEEPYMGEEVPIRWFNFEKVVQALTAKNVNYLNVEDLKDIVEKVCFIKDKVEAATMLNFYHDLGIIVRHRNTVVLRAQWLIDVFKQLITISPFDAREPKYSKMWKEMDESGLLNKELVDRVFSKFRQQGLIKEDILNMMEQFGLIAKFISSPTNAMYFVPCQLKTPPDAFGEMEPSPSDPCPLYLNFLGGFVPHGFFWQLVSRCIRWCSTNGFTQPPKLFLSASRFYVDKDSIHHLIFLCQKRFIKILLTPSKPANDGALVAKAREVRTFLEEAVKNLSNELPWLSNLKWDFCVACSDSLHEKKKCSKQATVSCHCEDCLCLIKILDKGQLSHCPRSDRVPTVIGLEKWFAAKAASPGNHPGTNALYKMTANPRGMTLIINNKLFNDGKKKTRKGSEKDVDLVKALFSDLGFMVQTEENLTKEDMTNKIDDVVCQDHSSYDCFVLWLMSHGESGKVMCSDGKMILIDTLHEMFSSCSTLGGKPKLFFIQACRGDEEDEGMLVTTDQNTPDISAYKQLNDSNEANKAVSPGGSVNKKATIIPKNSDFLYAFSTVDNFVSFRHEEQGSYFVRNLVEVFHECVANDHLLDILTSVNQKVSEEAFKLQLSGQDKMKMCKQIPEVRHTLRKKLRF